jgi:hypothetical protein
MPDVGLPRAEREYADSPRTVNQTPQPAILFRRKMRAIMTATIAYGKYEPMFSRLCGLAAYVRTSVCEQNDVQYGVA